MIYLDSRNFPLDIGIVNIVFKVCSLYSLPKRYEIIIENNKTANNADIYILTLENNASKLCVSSNAKVAINISNGGRIAPIKLNKNIFDRLSFKNSISIKVNIKSPKLIIRDKSCKEVLKIFFTQINLSHINSSINKQCV